MTSSTQKHEWRKHEKGLYLPKAKPELIEVPAHRFLTVAGEGNPNSEGFSDYIGVLYALAYGIKMTAKQPALAPAGHHDFTVYPLEGIWDINDDAKRNFSGTVNKDDFVYRLMIRQPDFVTDSFFHQILDLVKKKKPHPLLNEVKFEEIEDGRCIQMLHVGSYDHEPETFATMEAFAATRGVARQSKMHREIYLSDFRKTPADKLKTVLRFQVS